MILLFSRENFHLLYRCLEVLVLQVHLHPIFLWHLSDLTWAAICSKTVLLLTQSSSQIWFSNLRQGSSSRDLAFGKPLTPTFIPEVLKLCQRPSQQLLWISKCSWTKDVPNSRLISLNSFFSYMLLQLFLSILIN